MAGMLLVSGQRFITDRIKEYGGGSGLWCGLITNTSAIPQTATLLNGINELSSASATSYARKRISGWEYTNEDANAPTVSGNCPNFVADGTWSGVAGYVVTNSEINGTGLWVELFPSANRGDKTNGTVIKVIPKYEQKDNSEQ